uniref:Uncharacterized protein n=1 Tax=Caulerpa racemosa TaxID=76317 RepID=A0A1I9LKD0_CAURA|nr:hypothetical protein [Caulerpa racemosa]ANJ70791.1 hypothetical protein [Caulerpa racemosa]
MKENLINSEIGTEFPGESFPGESFAPIEPITPNHLPQGYSVKGASGHTGFVYAGVVPGRPPVYLGNDGPPGNGGGGSNGPGDDNFPDDSPDSPRIGYFALMALLGGVIVQIRNVIISFGIRILNTYSGNLLKALEKLLGQETNEETSPEIPLAVIEPPTVTARLYLPSLVPLRVAAASLVVSSYLFSPETLLRCLNLFFNQSAMLGSSFGRLHLVPHPLQAVAIFLGNGIAQAAYFTRRALIPAILLSRTLVVGLKLYVLLKLATFGVEVFRLFSILTPPWFKKGAQQVAAAIESSNQIEEVGSITENPFLFGF